MNEEAILTYTVGDPFSDIIASTWCEGIDNVDETVDCEFLSHGIVNTSIAGTYKLIYQATDNAGNSAELRLTVTVSDVVESNPDVLAYYSSAEGLSGNTLFLELRSIIQTDMIKVSYGDARYILDEADQDPNNSNNVLTIYDRKSVLGAWDGTTYTREHVWPNSRLGVSRVGNSTKNIGTDLHNLRAAIQSTNSSRSNKYFDVMTTNDAYYPGEDDKGDVARILFYMVVMYPNLDIVNVITSAMDEATYKEEGTYMAKMSVLLQWHIEDPVDDFERNRNEVIYAYQNNRNPFIDYPDYVALLWGNNPSTVSNSSQFIN